MNMEDCYDCTSNCTLQAHGNAITAALTKRSASDELLAAFIAKTCRNYREITDEMGRNAVNMAASVGRYRLLEWLLNNGAPVNSCDLEARNTPLHRALFYGAIDCAVLLLRHGANIDAPNEDTITPLLNILRIADYPEYQYPSSINHNNELRVWGSNKNHNLGIGDYESVGLPQLIDVFRKENLCINSAALGSYHSMFVDYRGRLYVVGHGTGGRLGIGVQTSLPVPRLVRTLEKRSTDRIVCVSVSQNHSLVLTGQSTVYACGLNDDGQLGIKTARKLVENFQEVTAFRTVLRKPLGHRNAKSNLNLKSVIACDHHSIAYSSDELFFWGRVDGQLGYLQPTPTSIQTPIYVFDKPAPGYLLVASNNVAIVFTNCSSYINLLYRYKTKTISLPKEKYEVTNAIKCIGVDGGDSSESTAGSCRALQILLVTSNDIVYVWRESADSYYRVIFGQLRITKIDKILCKANKMLILSDCCVYRGKLNKVHLEELRENKTKDLYDWTDCVSNVPSDEVIRVDLQRVPYVDRVVDIYCDEGYTSFAVIQESPTKYFRGPKLPLPKYNFKKLFDAPDYCGLYDVVLHVQGRQFPAHKFIIFKRAPGLQKIILNSQSDKYVHIDFEDLTAQMFEMVRAYIYMNYLPSGHDVHDLYRACGSDQAFKQTRTLEIFRRHLITFEIPELEECVKWLIQNNAKIWRCPFHRLSREEFPELYDVTITCRDGEKLLAHKCILVSQSEYFEKMFSHNWAEQDAIHFSTISIDYVESIIDSFYDNGDRFRRETHTEGFLCDMIVYCDQLFTENLRNICESQLVDKICIRKCAEYLNFACAFNCRILKTGCLEFICQNLARILSKRVLDDCEYEELRLLNAHYRQMFKKTLQFREITPDQYSITDEEILSVVGDFKVDLNSIEPEIVDTTPSKQKHSEPKMKQSSRQPERVATVSVQQQSSGESKPVSKPSSPANDKTNEWIVQRKEKHSPKNRAEVVADVVAVTPKLAAKIAVKSESNNAVLTKVYELNLSSLPMQSQKLSQKERKRLSSESNIAPSLPTPSTPPANPWATVKSPVTDLNGPSTSKQAWAAVKSPTVDSVGPSTSKHSWAAVKSPVVDPIGPSTSKQTSSFSHIVQNEIEQKNILRRLRNKPLVNTQIEEAAIAELLKHYTMSPQYFGEQVTVERKEPDTNIKSTQIWIG